MHLMGAAVLAVALNLSLSTVSVAASQQVAADDGSGQFNAIGTREDALLMVTLVRSTMIGVHQGLVSGNYSVMRDLAAPSFRQRNSAGDLERVFTPLKQQGVNLEAVAIIDPVITRASIDENRILLIEGTVATPPRPIRFEMMFQNIDRSWALFGIRIRPE